MKRLLLLLFAIIASAGFIIGQTSLTGKVVDQETSEPILFGNVALYKNGNLITGVETDFDGNFIISNIDPGTYDVEVSIVGYQSTRVTNVIVYAGKSNKLDVEMAEGVTLEEVTVVGYKVPLIEQDNTTQGGTITSEQIRNLPTRNINALASTTAGVASSDEGAALNFRGSRSDATNYYVDGIRVVGTIIPSSEIDQLQMITGGIEAQYGDVTGGIVSITTKGPSSKFSGGIEAETSEFLDDFGYNLFSANVSGPILKNSQGRSILGFRLSGEFRQRDEDDPPATPRYFLKDEMRDFLSQNPVTEIGQTRFPTAELLTNNDVRPLSANPYEKETQYRLTAKLDARVNDAIDVSMTGAYFDSEDQFTPSNAWITLNSFNNPTNNVNRYRMNFRFRHRFGTGVQSRALTDTDERAQKTSLIRNASYQLQFGYEKEEFSRKDPRHGDNLFDYGYIGEYDFEWVPVPGTDDVGNFRHIDYRQDFVEGGYSEGYQGSYFPNPGLAAYNNIVDQDDINDFIVRNGRISDVFNSAWGLHTNINQIYDRNTKGENERYTFNANASFDFVPGGSNKGHHNIQFGLLFEERISRSWTVDPFDLWQLMRQLANNHLTGVDTNKVVGLFPVNIPGFPLDSLPQYGALVDQNVNPNANLFFKNIRDLTGQAIDEYVNVDGLDPRQLSLDLFAPKELTDIGGIIGFSGFDYLGEKVSSDATWDDFWTMDAQGNRSFIVAPWRPNYSSAFIQDKFTFKDIIFRLGVRVDRYDANTKVLKDPLSFYEVMGAGEFHSRFGGEKPSTVSDDYKVYTESSTSNTVKAYREGEQWYLANGTPANSGALIFGGEVVNPKLVNPDVRVTDVEYNPDNSFRDYEVQYNWMPRLAFSFPISDVANFFAHYDVLVQRPSNNYVSPLTYFYFTEPGRIGTISNPNLKPQRTIDYAVGFQQKLSNTSALKINAYYREMRDMIQARTVLFVPILNSYETFGNEDFGTVKGFTFQYDLRRSGNVSARIDYTLQFADGTGSNANSQRGLTTRGNLRTLFPLSFDERHRINANIDFRYASGKRYNGPRWFGQDVFSNAGINLQATTFSGRPYTKRQQAEILGGSGTVGAINGARLPWTIRLDLNIDKSFRIGGAESKYPLDFNVYLRVQNLLDTRNIIGVYSATGSETDDGFLASSKGQATINDLENSGRELQPYLDAYTWRLFNPDLYSLPRRIVLGARVYF